MYKFKQLVVLFGLTLLFAVNAFADPTKPEYLLSAAITEATPAGEIIAAKVPVLSYIQIGQRRSAVINGQLVKVGDRVANYLVQQIDARQVVLQQGDQRLVLKLFQTMKK